MGGKGPKSNTTQVTIMQPHASYAAFTHVLSPIIMYLTSCSLCSFHTCPVLNKYVFKQSINQLINCPPQYLRTCVAPDYVHQRSQIHLHLRIPVRNWFPETAFPGDWRKPVSLNWLEQTDGFLQPPAISLSGRWFLNFALGNVGLHIKCIYQITQFCFILIVD